MLKKDFPKSLHEAPALLPSDNTSLRRAVEAWFRDIGVVPRVVAEFEDLALMKVMAAEGRGFVSVVEQALDRARECCDVAGIDLGGKAEDVARVG